MWDTLFERKVRELVRRCDGDLAEAQRKSGYRKDFIVEVMDGREPVHPTRSALVKLGAVISAAHPDRESMSAMVERVSPDHPATPTPDDDKKLADFIKSLPFEKKLVFFDLARDMGYEADKSPQDDSETSNT